MSGSTYLITVETAEGEQEAVAFAYGDLYVMQYITRRVDAAMAGVDDGTTFRATLGEVPHIGAGVNGISRTLAAVTGDADVVAYVLRKKVAAERKANGEVLRTAPEQG